MDYGIRAVVELAGAGAAPDRPVTAERLATAQDIPPKFLESILLQLRRGGVVNAQRGPEGGYWLAADPSTISVADIIRAVEGPLADVHGKPPEQVDYRGPAAGLQGVWVATRAALRTVLEEVTLADVAAGTLPAEVEKLLREPDAWSRR